MKNCVRLGFVALFAGVLAVPSPSDACGVAPPREVVVEVASESAIIIWDKEAKTQHFIRRATFTAAGPGSAPVKDFGFLVPTPSVPALEEADDKAFDELATITAPKTETHPRPSSGGCIGGCGLSADKSAGEAPPASVEVLAEKRVGGYDAKVLKANDANALTAWLNAREYEVRPALTRWLKPYIEKGWVVTAFKIVNDASAAAAPVGSAAVRMSFTADEPFFPYREPDDMRAAKSPRLLRVYAIADQKMAGSVGRSSWEGKTAWAGQPTAGEWGGVLSHLKIPGWKPAEGAWLTEFEDASSPRKGDSDLFFSPAQDQSPVQRPNRIVYAARTDGGAVPPVAGLAAVVACLWLSRFGVARLTRR